MAAAAEVANAAPALQRCAHQVGGHMTKDQKPDTLVDANGHFYKPYQAGDRNLREAAFYGLVWGPVAPSMACGSTPGFHKLEGHEWGKGPSFEAKPGSVHKPSDVEGLRAFIPKSYGITDVEERHYLVMEDVVGSNYKKPTVMDLKMGFVTGYPWAPQEYRDKCKGKDESSTQGSLGFRISGMQVYDVKTGETEKKDRQYGKTLDKESVAGAFRAFAAHLGSAAVYRGDKAILEQVRAIRAWFAQQTSFCFYQASLLFAYEGSATDLAAANVQVRLIDFAHTFPTNGEHDDNFLRGLDSLITLLEKLE